MHTSDLQEVNAMTEKGLSNVPAWHGWPAVWQASLIARHTAHLMINRDR